MSMRQGVALAAAVVVAAGFAPPSSGASPASRYHVSASVQPSAVLVGRQVTATGRVSPPAPGHRVKLQVLTDAGWQTVAMASLGTHSRYAVTYTPPAAGTYRLRVRKPPGEGHRRGTSTPSTVTVTPSLPPT